MAVNWLSWVSRILTVAPTAVLQAEAIVQEGKSGATKKQLAMDSLGLSNEVAGMIAPEHQPLFNAVSGFASGVIDGVVAVANTQGNFNKAAAAAQVASGGLAALPAVIASFGTPPPPPA